MNVMDTDKAFLLGFLSYVVTIIPLLEDGSQYCDIVDSVGTMRASLDAGAWSLERKRKISGLGAERKACTPLRCRLWTMLKACLRLSSEGYQWSIQCHRSSLIRLAEFKSRERGEGGFEFQNSAFTEEPADGGSALSVIKNGLRSMFRQSNATEHASNGTEVASDGNIPDALAKSMRKSKTVSCSHWADATN